MKIQVGQSIRVLRSHWWRAGDEAKVIELMPDGRFMVEFEQPGIGFDGGIHLILGVQDVEVVE